MTTPNNPIEPFSPFLPSTFNWPEEEDRVRSFFTETLADFSDVINDKRIGAFTQSAENQNGEKWSYDTTSKVRSGYQTIARVPAYPASGTLTLTLADVPQSATSIPNYPLTDINPQFVISLTYGVASKPCSGVGNSDGDYITFLNSGNPKIVYNMSDTTITITTTALGTGYSGFIVINYIRDGV